MNKAIKYSINGALLGGLAGVIGNLANQANSESEEESYEWSSLIKSFANGAILGGVSGFFIGTLRDREMSTLFAVAGGTLGIVKSSLKNNSDNDDILIHKAEMLQKLLYREFGEVLSEYPSMQGSMSKGTSIVGSDIDIHLKFAKRAGSISEVRSYVEEFFQERYRDRYLAKIRNQNCSVGVFYETTKDVKRIDIVPMRDIENEENDAYLFAANENRIIKTNSRKQNAVLTFSVKERNIIKLLKSLKNENSIIIPSVLIEHLVKRAFTQTIIPNKLDKALLSVLYFIGDNIVSARIVDPANTNNIISNVLSQKEKEEIQMFCFRMLDDVKKDKRNIIDYFPNLEVTHVST